MSKILIYSQEDLALILELEKEKNEELQQENEILRENAKHNDKVVDKVNWDNMLLKKENKQLKNILTDLEEWCNDGIKDELVKFDYGTEIIGEPIKIHIASYEMVLDKIQKLKEEYK